MKSNKRRSKYILNKKEKSLIKQMYFGPYLDEWKDENGIVDNMSSTIAKRLNLHVSIVTVYITKILDTHFNKL